MKPPKCRLCGSEHWNHEAHVFDRNQPVTKVANKVVTCNQCVTKDAEIARLTLRASGQPKHSYEEATRIKASVSKPKRDRAEYMRNYRKKPLGIAYG